MRSPPRPPQHVTAPVAPEDANAAERRAPTSELVTTSLARTAAAALGVAALLVLLTWSMLTDPARLVADFAADTWLLSHQAEALRHGTFPSLSMTTASAAFYPVYAFYGGTLFAFGGVIALLVGTGNAAQAIVYLLALGAAYGGWLWLARMAGLRSWLAHAPAILYLTAPYVLTNINVRQDVAEVVATSMLPPMVAATLSILRADRLHPGPAAALAASTIFFGGSHNLTLLWATTVLTISAAIVAVAVPQARTLVTTRGTLRVLAIAIPAMAVNAWYLLPGLAYHTDTVIAINIDEWKAILREARPELAAQHLLGLRHPGGIPRSSLSITLPVLAIAWVLVTALVSRASWRGTWARMLAVLMLLTAGLLMVMVNSEWILLLPDPWTMIQFSYRLETFVLFGICGSVIAALRVLDRDTHRWLIALLLPILTLSVISAVVLRPHIPPSSYRPTTDIDKFAAASIGDYADGTLSVLPTDQRKPVLRIKRADLQQGRFVGNLPVKPGELLYTNVLTPARMLQVEGAQVVGRWSQPWWSGWQEHWALVLKIDNDATRGKAHVVIRQARSLPIVAGRLISILGLLGLAANAVVIAHGGWRRHVR